MMNFYFYNRFLHGYRINHSPNMKVYYSILRNIDFFAFYILLLDKFAKACNSLNFHFILTKIYFLKLWTHTHENLPNYIILNILWITKIQVSYFLKYLIFKVFNFIIKHWQEIFLPPILVYYLIYLDLSHFCLIKWNQKI